MAIGATDLPFKSIFQLIRAAMLKGLDGPASVIVLTGVNVESNLSVNFMSLSTGLSDSISIAFLSYRMALRIGPARNRRRTVPEPALT